MKLQLMSMEELDKMSKNTVLLESLRRAAHSELQKREGTVWTCGSYGGNWRETDKSSYNTRAHAFQL